MPAGQGPCAHSEESAARENRVNQAIAAYLQAVDRGDTPTAREVPGRACRDFRGVARFFFRWPAANCSRSPELSIPSRMVEWGFGARDPAARAGACFRIRSRRPTRRRRFCRRPWGPAAAETPRLAGMGSRQFSDHFLLHEIARGGMGVVFKGRDTSIGREIAVKVLLDRHQGETELLQRFVEEAQIAGQLQHPGVTPVYEMGQLPDQRPYFTMKLVKGETLSRLLKNRPNPAHDRPRFLKIFEQVCQTLAYAHSRCVIHRDLKPANIMVGSFGEVQVMDWGLAKVLGDGTSKAEPSSQTASMQVSMIRTARSDGSGDSSGSGSQTQAGSILGTPAYMAPEQAMGYRSKISTAGRADVFGLGAILSAKSSDRPAPLHW